MANFEAGQYYDKYKVAASFDKAAEHYEFYSCVQRRGAESLLNILEARINKLPEGPILEIGCGTGLITQRLVQLFSNRNLEITDLSPQMLHFCQKNVEISKIRQCFVTFRLMDGEKLDTNESTYALIISNFVVQWFSNIARSLNRALQMLSPGGVLLVSFPNHKSFPEWRNICRLLNLPFTGNQLPKTEDLIAQLSTKSIQLNIIEDEITVAFQNASDFFKSLKFVGAGLNAEGKRLSVPQIKQLINYWDRLTAPGELEIRYYVTWLCCKKGRSEN